GFGIGYSSCSHCRGGYLNGYVAPLYGGYYAYPPSYGAVYYDRPATVYYRGRYARGYDRPHYHHRGRYDRHDYGHRARYYDRDGY
ncbi:MAG: hypothetical protein WBW61_02695, partial [Rhodanobacteraceae bacterium]